MPIIDRKWSLYINDKLQFSFDFYSGIDIENGYLNIHQDPIGTLCVFVGQNKEFMIDNFKDHIKNGDRNILLYC